MKKCYFLIICKLVVLFYSPLVLADQLTLEEMPTAIEEYNKTASEEKKIASARSYNQFRGQIPRTSSLLTLYRDHKKKFGTGKGLSKYLFKKVSRRDRLRSNRLTLEEMSKAIEEYNKAASEEKKIASARSYNQFRGQISGAPSWPALYKDHEKKFGTGEGLSKYLFKKVSRRGRPRSNRLTLEEMPKAIEEYNKAASEEDKIVSQRSYNRFQDQIPRAPSWPTLHRDHEKKFRTRKGLSKYLFKVRDCEGAMTSL